MKTFIGIDLGIRRIHCVIERKRKLRSLRMTYDDFVRFSNELKGENVVIAIDGPQGLSGTPGHPRQADILVNSPVKCGYEFPPISNPYSEFVRLSVKLYYHLFCSGFSFLDSKNITDAQILETFPGEIWKRLGIKSKKRKREGIKERVKVLAEMGLNMKEVPLEHDILDACACLLTAFSYTKGNFLLLGADLMEDRRKKVLREGWLILPFV